MAWLASTPPAAARWRAAWSRTPAAVSTAVAAAERSAGMAPEATGGPWSLDNRGVADSPYLTFARAEWAQLRAATPLTLAEGDLDVLRGINERLDLEEVVDVY